MQKVDFSRKWWVMLSVAMGTFLCTIDGSIVTVSLPTLEKTWHTSFATVQWVVVAYLLVITSLMLGMARLGEMYGKKRVYMPGMVIFTGASVLCGLSPTVEFLIGFRALQGIGAAMIMSLGMAIVTEAFPPSERGRALGIMGTVVSVGISIGPTLGGLLIGTVGWRAIFLVNLPVGLIGLYLVRLNVPDYRPPSGQRFDRMGAAVLFVTLAMFASGLTFGPDTGWDDLRILGLLIGSVVGLFAFLYVESHAAYPMVDLRLFRNLLFSISLMTGFIGFIVITGMFVLPFYLEIVKGYDVKHVGLFQTVVPIMLGITAPIAGSLSDRYGSRGISLIGLIIMVVGCWTISTIKMDTSALGYIIRVLPLGLGAGLFQSPNNSAIMGSVPRERLGVASGLLSLSRTLGQVTGMPVIGAIFASRVIRVANLAAGTDATDAPHWAIVKGVETSFLAAAGLIMIGVLLALLAFLKDRQAKRVPVVTEAQLGV
jgi:EmrB/QacA subfamily drug resistance transporter